MDIMLNRLVLSAGLLLGLYPAAWGHGVPVEVTLANDGRLDVTRDPLTGLPAFAPGELIAEPLAGAILSETPGIAVAGSSIQAGTDLRLRGMGPLIYWDGHQVSPTSAQLEIFSPQGDESLIFTESSRLAQEMVWGQFTGTPHWHAHGLFVLDPMSASPGIYATFVQIASPAYPATPEFLLPLVYDPQGSLSAADIQLGVSALTALAIRPGDADGDGDVDGSDLTTLIVQWTGALDPSQGTRLRSDGDFDGDGDVDASDLTVLTLGWTGASASRAAGDIPAVPEPSAGILLAAGGWMLVMVRRGRSAKT
jgi:hypothetical protein